MGFLYMVFWYDVRHLNPFWLIERCRFCMGTGNVTVELGGDQREVSRCINCDGVGSLTCTTCQGTGIQPRYLDRRYEFYIAFCLLLVQATKMVKKVTEFKTWYFKLMTLKGAIKLWARFYIFITRKIKREMRQLAATHC